MAGPSLILDHVNDALALLTSDYDDATNVRALVSALVGQVQELEELFYALIVERGLDSAYGQQLDVYGKVLKESRAGLTDAQYRPFLQARILTNLSEGEAPVMIEVLKIITNAGRVQYAPTYPAALIITYTSAVVNTDSFRDRVRAQIESITPSGVGVHVVEASEGSFGFEGTPGALGFDDGIFAEAI